MPLWVDLIQAGHDFFMGLVEIEDMPAYLNRCEALTRSSTTACRDIEPLVELGEELARALGGRSVHRGHGHKMSGHRLKPSGWPGDGSVRFVDEGLPIAYEVLDQGVPCYGSDGEQVGTVDHVISAPAEDIFHGIVLRAEGGRRFVAADQVASLHEHGVDLRIDAAAAAALPEPNVGAAALRLREPGVKPSRWTHIVDLVSGKDSRRRDWTEED